MNPFFLFYLTFCFIGILNINAQKNKSESIKNGTKLYRDFCYRCHGFNGEGQTDLIPPLKSSDYLLNNIDVHRSIKNNAIVRAPIKTWHISHVP